MSRIVSVAACGNGSGKTTLLATILAAFPGRFAAVKFTTVYKDGANCPRTEAACACRELRGAFTIVDDPARLDQEETDTGRLGRAGAASVRWCLARPGSHAAAWSHLLEHHLDRDACVLTEGNSAIPILAPDLLISVLSPSVPKERWKPDSWDLALRAGHVVVNSWGSEPKAARALADEAVGRLGGRRPIVQDLSTPLHHWEDDSIHRAVERLLVSPRASVA